MAASAESLGAGGVLRVGLEPGRTRQRQFGGKKGGADLLRRALGKKIRTEIDAQRKILLDGATGRGVPEDKAIEIFESMSKFADYGFNKCHSARYAIIPYQMAWIKQNHPVEFLAASMSLAISNTDKLAALRQEAERLGVRVLPPGRHAGREDRAARRLQRDVAAGAGAQAGARGGAGGRGLRALAARFSQG